MALVGEHYIEPPEPFHAFGIYERALLLNPDAKVSPAKIGHELKSMADLGMVIEHKMDTAEKKNYYRRLDSPLWEIVEIAVRTTKQG
jgi:hypothetical protein